MKLPDGQRSGYFLFALLDLVACIAGFFIAAIIDYGWLDPMLLESAEPWVLPAWSICSITAWFALSFPESRWHEGFRLWVDGFLSVVGSNLLVQFGLNYLFGATPTSWLVILLGSALSLALAGLLRKCIPDRWVGRGQGLLLVGFDAGLPPLVSALHGRLVGGVETSPAALPPDVPFLGPMSQLDPLCQSLHSSLLVSGKPGIALPSSELLRLHYAGVQIESAPMVYERVLQRIAWPYMQPSQLLFYLNPGTSHAMLAFQAIYKNLLGLALRVIAAPVLMLLSLLIVISSGAPALEHIECLGFQRIPFQLLRFRIRRSDGTLSTVGKWIARLHLTNLPYLINVVRGEMTLFGPAPARTAFANRLSQLLPPYLYRFTVKPGILGWYQATLGKTGGPPDEIQRLECDLYYIRQESPSLDLDILLRTLVGRSVEKTPDAG